MTVLGGLSSVAGLHSWASGLKTGKVLDQLLNEVQSLGGAHRLDVQRLSDSILYSPALREIHTNTGRIAADLRELRELLTPLQTALGGNILSSAMTPTPSRLRDAFRSNPWSVLLEIRPVSRVTAPTNPDLVPVLFSDQDSYYVGWQTRGALPMLFDLQYEPTPVAQNLPVSSFSLVSSPIWSAGGAGIPSSFPSLFGNVPFSDGNQNRFETPSPLQYVSPKKAEYFTRFRAFTGESCTAGRRYPYPPAVKGSAKDADWAFMAVDEVCYALNTKPGHWIPLLFGETSVEIKAVHANMPVLTFELKVNGRSLGQVRHDFDEHAYDFYAGPCLMRVRFTSDSADRRGRYGTPGLVVHLVTVDGHDVLRGRTYGGYGLIWN